MNLKTVQIGSRSDRVLLEPKEQMELVDLLRKNLLYQTPRPLFESDQDQHPKWISVSLVPEHWKTIMGLIHSVEGWTLPPHERRKVLEAHEGRCRTAFGDGADYDLSDFSYGDLMAMWEELKGIDELGEFRSAIGDTLDDLRAADQ